MKKKVLYVTSNEVPYRVKFFNQLALLCDLTVLYEREKTKNRDEDWSKSVKKKYKVGYLHGIKYKNENTISLKILKYIFGDYDKVIIGCYNSPIQMLCILILRFLKKPYILNVDGEIFLSGNKFKVFVKKIFIKGADKYIVAGKSSKQSLSQIAADEKIICYPFSSLMNEEIEKNSKLRVKNGIKDYILVIGQYYDYKGLDIAVTVAKMLPNIKWKFVGTGNRTEMFIKEQGINKIKNIEVVPFLQKEELMREYCECKMLVLPSRRECWGLVVNEAASFGTPIVSTWGSGAAVEFLGENEKYRKFLASINNPKDLMSTIQMCLNEEYEEYSEYLLNMSKKYSIEKCVGKHMEVIE